MKVIAIGGSPRANGNTSFLIDQVLTELASQGIETEKILLSQYKVNFCLGHSNCGSLPACLQKDDTPQILDKFLNADGIVMATPVYYYSVSAQMKTFIDRNYFAFTHNRKIQARIAGFIAVGGGGGADMAIDELKKVLGFSGIPYLAVTGYAGPPGAIKDKADIVKKAREMGQEMAAILNK
jgi:multimeric flavodoxin WrbA